MVEGHSCEDSFSTIKGEFPSTVLLALQAGTAKAVTSHLQHNGWDAFEVHVVYGTSRTGISHSAAF